jgi:hypothetical protein
METQGKLHLERISGRARGSKLMKLPRGPAAAGIDGGCLNKHDPVFYK